MNQDAVDKIRSQWTVEKPELPLDAMETLGRLKRCSALYQPLLDQTFAQFKLSSWEFDVLATLRRSGAPFCLTPTELFSALMVTSGTMTHRLKTLESKGWIKRISSDGDARQKKVQLTDAGYDLIESALPAHVENMNKILDHLSKPKRQALNAALKDMLAVFEALHPADTSLPPRLSDQTHGS